MKIQTTPNQKTGETYMDAMLTYPYKVENGSGETQGFPLLLPVGKILGNHGLALLRNAQQ